MPSLNAINKNLLRKFGAAEELYEETYGLTKNNLIEAYEKALDDIEKELAKLYASIKDKPTLDKANRYNRLDKLFDNIEEKLKGLGVEEASIDRISIKNSFRQGYYSKVYAVENSFASNISFNLLSGAQVTASLSNPLQKIQWPESIKDNMKTLNKQLQTQITSNLIRGKSYQKTAKDIAEIIIFPEVRNKSNWKGAVTKAFRIARTETHRAQNAGSDLAYDETAQAAERLGLKKLRKVWLSALDGRTRSSHRSADGKFAGTDGNFRLFGAVFASPGNSGIAGEDINCRCSYYTKIPGVKNRKRFDNIKKKPIPNQTFEQWEKAGRKTETN